MSMQQHKINRIASAFDTPSALRTTNKLETKQKLISDMIKLSIRFTTATVQDWLVDETTNCLTGQGIQGGENTCNNKYHERKPLHLIWGTEQQKLLSSLIISQNLETT